MSTEPVPIPEPYCLRRVAPGDGRALARFYRELSRRSRQWLTPLGLKIDRNTCELICFDNWLRPSGKYDVVLTMDEQLVGWGFIWGVQEDVPSLGLVIADAHQHRGLGKALVAHLVGWAGETRLRGLCLTVDADHAVARHLYESAGFTVTGEAPGPRGRRYITMRAEFSSASTLPCRADWPR